MDATIVMDLPAGPDRNPTLFDNSSGQWNIACDDNIPRSHSGHDGMIRDIRPVSHGHASNECGLGHTDRLIRNDHQSQLFALASAEENVLDRNRASVGVDPEGGRLNHHFSHCEAMGHIGDKWSVFPLDLSAADVVRRTGGGRRSIPSSSSDKSDKSDLDWGG
jgi:hypothetical protein